MIKRLLLALAVTVVSLTPAFASPSLFTLGDLRAVSLPPGDPGAGGALTRAFIGEITGDHIPDAVILRGGYPTIVSGPTVFQARVKISQTAGDIALFPGAGPGGADAIVAAHSGAAKLWWFDDVTRQMTSSSLGGLWGGSRRVLVGRLDSGGQYDLVAVKANGTSLRIQLNPLATPMPGPFIATPPQAAGTILDLALVDWNGDSVMEIAIGSTAGLEIFSTSGTLLASYLSALEAAIVVPFKDDDFSTERVAFLYDSVGSNDWKLVVVDSTHVESILNLGPVAAVGADAGDVDGDGKDDLVLRHQVFQDPVLFTNLSDPGLPSQKTYSFASFCYVQLGLGSDPAPEELSWPVLADFDLDGDNDLFVPVQADESVMLLHNQLESSAERHPVVTGDSLYYFDGAPSLPELQLDLDPPLIASPGMDWVEIVIWKQETPVSPLTLLATQHVFFDTSSGWFSPMTVTIDDPQVVSPAVSYILCRMVDRNGSGDVIAAAPAGLFAFYTNSQTPGHLGYAPGFGLPEGGWEPLPCSCSGITQPPATPAGPDDDDPEPSSG